MSEEKRTRKQRPFPRDTLQEALKIAQTIRDQNNGEPMKRIFVADHLKVKPESSNFRYLIGSSNQYKLVKGGFQAEYIALTPLGDSLTKAEGRERIAFLQEALQGIPIFKSFYQRYRDAKLPTEDYARKLLKDEFKVPEEHLDECYNLIVTNGRFAGIIQDVAGAPRVVFEKAPVLPPEEATEGEKERAVEITPIPPTPTPPTAPPIIAPKPKQIFIAHGKNKVPLEQLEKILTRFRVPYKVAIEEPHKGRPISQKVADIMNSCTSAIFIFTADEEVIDSEGKKTYRPSDNVVYELGVAGYLYGKNIVIFKEDAVTFASDFSDLGYITFEKDNLHAKASDLLNELIGFGLLKIEPA